jgi:hypothetical protein
MYETPKLNVIGDAREVVLGYIDTGLDMDGTRYIPDLEYGDDQLPLPLPNPWNL